MVMIGGVIGPLLGGVLGDFLIRRTARGYFYVAAVAAVLTSVPLAFILIAFQRVPLFGAVLLEALFGNMTTGVVLAVAVTVVLAELRATATALLLTVVHLFGDAISQPLVGRLSTTIEHGGAAFLVNGLSPLGLSAPAHHLSIALVTVTVPAVFLAGALYFLAAKRVATRAGSVA